MCAHQSEQRQPPRMRRCFFATDETPFLHEIFRKKLTDFLSPNWFSSWSQRNRNDTILLKPHARSPSLDATNRSVLALTPFLKPFVRRSSRFSVQSHPRSRGPQSVNSTPHTSLFFSCLHACVIICHTTLAQVFVRVISSMCHAPECLISLRPSLRTLHLSLPSSTSSS